MAADDTSARKEDLSRAEACAKEIYRILDALPLAERETIIRDLGKSIRSRSSGAKAGDILDVIIRATDNVERAWSVEEMKRKVEAHGVAATSKQVFNAVGYLARKGRITRLGYGRYMVNGVSVVTSDDLGGQPSITESDLDD